MGAFFSRKAVFLGIVLVAVLFTSCDREQMREGRRTTLLHWASEEGDRELVLELLEHGADIDAVDGSGSTPLQLAAEKNHPETVLTLLNAGSDHRALISGGRTLMHWAAEHGFIDVLTYLIQAERQQPDDTEKEHTPLIAIQDAEGCTPITRAAEYDQREAVLFLVRHGAEVNESWIERFSLQGAVFD
jgi:ankyrin repeat protein